MLMRRSVDRRVIDDVLREYKLFVMSRTTRLDLTHLVYESV
jgi:hypothetical protein